MYSVGVGTAIDLGELISIASSLENVEEVQNFDELSGLVNKLAAGQCSGTFQFIYFKLYFVIPQLTYEITDGVNIF